MKLLLFALIFLVYDKNNNIYRNNKRRYWLRSMSFCSSCGLWVDLKSAIEWRRKKKTESKNEDKSYYYTRIPKQLIGIIQQAWAARIVIKSYYLDNNMKVEFIKASDIAIIWKTFASHTLNECFLFFLFYGKSKLFSIMKILFEFLLQQITQPRKFLWKLVFYQQFRQFVMKKSSWNLKKWLCPMRKRKTFYFSFQLPLNVCNCHCSSFLSKMFAMLLLDMKIKIQTYKLNYIDYKDKFYIYPFLCFSFALLSFDEFSVFCSIWLVFFLCRDGRDMNCNESNEKIYDFQITSNAIFISMFKIINSTLISVNNMKWLDFFFLKLIAMVLNAFNENWTMTYQLMARLIDLLECN